MGGDVAGHALWAAHGGLYQVAGSSSKPVVLGKGTGYAIAAGRHVRIDYFVGQLSARGQRHADALAQLLAVVVFAIVTWYGARVAWDDYRFGVLSPGLGHPQWIYMVSLPVFGLACAGRALGRMARALRAPAESAP